MIAAAAQGRPFDGDAGSSTALSEHVRRGVPISKQCACPLDGVPAATGNAMRGRRCLSVGPASTVSLCLRRKSGDRRSVKREGGSCALCDEDTENEGEGRWCWGSHAYGDEVLGSSLITMPRTSKSKLNKHPSRHAARHARVAYLRTRSKKEFTPTRIKIQGSCATGLRTPQDSARGRCVRRGYRRP